jgi:PAS domain S-box-containing protein
MSAARFPRPNAGILCLLAGTAATGLHFALPQGGLGQAIVYQAIGALAALTVLVATIVRRPERRLQWWLLAAALGFWSLGDGILSFYPFVLHREAPYPSIADWSYLIGYAAMLASISALIRSRNRPGLNDLLDGAVILCGSGVVLWALLIEPTAEDTSLSLVGQIVALAYPTFDLLLLVALAQLLGTPGRRGFAFVALILGGLSLFLVDVGYATASLDGSYSSGSWIDAGWMLNYTLWAAAACHPSMRELHLFAPVRQTILTWRRLAFLGVAAMTVPLATLEEAPGGRSIELYALTGLALVMVTLIFVRMALLFREHGRSAAALREAEARTELEQESRARFQAAARTLDCAIYEWSPKGGVLWTEGLTTAFGYPLAEVEGTREWWLARVHPEDRARVEAAMEAADEKGPEGQAEFRFLAHDGQYRDVWDRWLVTRGRYGTPEKRIGGFVDVTERNRLQDALHQSRKIEAIGQLAGGVAHDFNNLLLSVTAAVGLAGVHADENPDLKGLLTEISGAADRGASLTQQLLTFGRRQVLAQRVIDLEASVDALAPMLRRLLGEDVAVQADLAVDLWRVKADPTQIDQVLLNLCVNARDAMPNGGVVTVAARNVALSTTAAERLGIAAGEYAAVSVKDSGRGMDAETAARIFEPFFTTKELGKGTGLGLSTVYGIASQSGGAIDVESELGHGTTFTLYLPRTEEDATVPQEEPAEVEPQGRSETILLVEDERSVRTLVQRLLEVEGYVVITADSAEDALVVADREADIDLVLTDMVMPGMNGRELMEQLERERPGMKVVYTSGYFDDRASPAKGAPFLQKPYTHQALARTVREALAS